MKYVNKYTKRVPQLLGHPFSGFTCAWSLRRVAEDPLAEAVHFQRVEDVDALGGHLVQLALDLLLAPALDLVRIQLTGDVALAELADPLEVLGDVVAHALGDHVRLVGLLENQISLGGLGLGPDNPVAVLQLLVGPVVHVLGLALAVVLPDGSHVAADLALVHDSSLPAQSALGAVLAVLGLRLIDGLLLAGGDDGGLVVLVALGLVHRSELEPAVPQGVGLRVSGQIGLGRQLSLPGLLLIILAHSVQDVDLHHIVAHSFFNIDEQYHHFYYTPINIKCQIVIMKKDAISCIFNFITS